MEIERIQQLAELTVHEDEKAKVLSTIDVISDTFMQMLHATKQYMLEGVRQKDSLADASAALRLLHDMGATYGLDFPNGGDEPEVADYVIRFGREIMYSRRESEQ